jgi:hypothetical protein
MNIAVSNSIVGLNLIFIIIFFLNYKYICFSDKLKTSTLRLRKLRNNLSLLCFATKEKQNFIHNLRLATFIVFGIVNITGSGCKT